MAVNRTRPIGYFLKTKSSVLANQPTVHSCGVSRGRVRGCGYCCGRVVTFAVTLAVAVAVTGLWRGCGRVSPFYFLYNFISVSNELKYRGLQLRCDH